MSVVEVKDPPPRYRLIMLCAFSGVPSWVLCNPTPAICVKLSVVKYSRAAFAASSSSSSLPVVLALPGCGLEFF